MDTDTMLLGFLLDLFITFDIYTLPILIWRYVVKKEPIEVSKAKKITVIYGIIAWVAMSVMTYIINGKMAGVSIFIWSYINYRILIAKNSKEHEQEQPTAKVIIEEDPEVTRARIAKIADELYLQYIGRSDADLNMIIKSNSSEAAEIAARRVLEQRDAQRRGL